MISSVHTTTNQDDATRFPVEYLNRLTPAGLSPHKLIVKKDIILILLRNLNPREYLCNGTRFNSSGQFYHFLHCKIDSGEHQNNDALLPRIKLSCSDGDFPFSWKRRQFPVRPEFAMTIILKHNDKI